MFAARAQRTVICAMRLGPWAKYQRDANPLIPCTASGVQPSGIPTSKVLGPPLRVWSVKEFGSTGVGITTGVGTVAGVAVAGTAVGVGSAVDPERHACDASSARAANNATPTSARQRAEAAARLHPGPRRSRATS